MKFNMKNATTLLYIVNWALFFICLLGSVFLFRGDGWLDHSISFLGTKDDSQHFFSFSLFWSSVSGLLFSVLALMEIVVKKSLRGKQLRRASVAAALLLIAHAGLMLAAFFPTDTYKVIHWTGGGYYFGAYPIAMLTLSYTKVIKDDSLMRVLFIFYVLGGLFGYFVFNSILYAEVFMITILFVWSYLLYREAVPEPTELNLSKFFNK